MTNPSFEHEPFREPTMPFKVMDELVKYSPNGNSFRGSLNRLDKRYRDSDFCMSLEDSTAALLELDPTLAGTEGVGLFYAGTIFGTHAALYPLSTQEQQQILQSNAEVIPFVRTYDEIDQSINNLNGEEIAILFSATTLVNEGIASSDTRSFARGAIYAMNTVGHILHPDVQAA